MSNLRDLLNPVGDDKRHMSHSSNGLGVEHGQDHYMGNAPSVQELGNIGSIDETSQAFWWALNGDATETDDYVQSSLANTEADPLFPEYGVSVHLQNNAPDVDLQLGSGDWDIDFDMNGFQTTSQPNGEENIPPDMPTALKNFQFLQLPTESSREGSAMTPELPMPSRSNATPITIPDDEDVIVHYGMLHNIEVKLVPDDMSSIDERLAAEASAYQYLTSTEYLNQLMLCFPEDGKHFGHLPKAVGETLLPLMMRPSVDIEPLSLRYDLREVVSRANKPADARVKVDINIYGLRSKALDIGRILSDGKLWLQRSTHRRRDITYENPHFLNINVQDTGIDEIQNIQQAPNGGAPKKMSKEDQLRKMVDEVYKTVENNREIEMVEGGDKVTRQLLRHQKEALGFMLERESGHINEKYRLWEEIEYGDKKVQYRHRITKRRKDIRPEEKGGGILADDMGMGKSLSILALIMKTLDNGQEWAEERNAEHKSRRSFTFSRSTLVVVSAALLVDEWMNEVQKHLQNGIRVVKYHGENRPKTIEELKDPDIVLTGKPTAHIIRRPSTKFFQACEYLHANSRWCLSGTPIQNKLADIGSLFRFIRAEPFDKASEFRKWIEVPFDNSCDDPEIVRDRLVLLLEALCLRRTREVLNLPRTRQYIRHMDFSPPERDQYDKTKAVILRNMEHRMGDAEKGSQFGMFQMWLQLRIVCNHGTYQKLFSWHRRSLLEEREAVVGTAGQYGEISCVGCEQPMPVLGCDLTKKMFDDECSHIMCSKCIEESRTSLPETRNRCPICVRWYKEPSASRDGETLGYSERPRKRRKANVVEDDHESYFNEQGISTKIQTLVEDVQKDLWTTKSIIFSCWTRTLYLISRHLEQARIPYLQLDGDSPLRQRQATLHKFEKGDKTPVLIMTTGTGAFGLNLTCANRIFISELQWNPSVESQAISRAIRLGQQSEVRVTRYIINNTVEEDIRRQQEYKKHIAALGFEECAERRSAHSVSALFDACDAAQETCICTKDEGGLSCSGLGIRHRFNKGVAARGKWAGKTIDRVYEENEWKVSSADRDASASSASSSAADTNPETTEPHHDDNDDQQDDDIEYITSDNEIYDLVLADSQLPADREIFMTLLKGVPDNIPPWKRNLFMTFSRCISTEMVAIDGLHNDWRHLLLPLAQQDELVMDAVLTVSAFHFHINKLDNNLRKNQKQYSPFGTNTYDTYVPDPYQLLGRTLQGLRQRQELVSNDQTTQHSVLISLLLLMTSVLVTGGSDFPVLLRMLESALDAIGGKEGLGTGILAGFIMRELHKIRVYAAPHLGEETGLQTISSQARTDQLFGCLNHCLQLYPEHAPLFSQVSSLVYQARDIYLQQVLSDHTSNFFDFDPIPTNPESVARVQRFIEALEQFPETSPVAHMLVWTTFVAASDAQLEEHKIYFENVLRRHHARSGFGNLLKGIEALKRMWSRKPGERWTTLLPQTKVLVA
ncbi:helicase-like transcription factor [Fusarium circinatum]|uniref:Helicase-like transcription factor n=1 Tax=Fusarium circinatum TaxID=48490 RepID=A0A8H5UFL4_FUSCI|nr:helicase-like transcription factor [Fusarium circinatum]